MSWRFVKVKFCIVGNFWGYFVCLFLTLGNFILFYVKKMLATGQIHLQCHLLVLVPTVILAAAGLPKLSVC